MSVLKYMSEAGLTPIGSSGWAVLTEFFLRNPRALDSDEVVQFATLLRKNRASVAKLNGYFAGICGSKKQRLALAKEFLKLGVNIDAQNRYGNTCLMNAAGWGHTEIVEFMLEQGADKKIKNKKGQRAKNIAKDAGQDATYRLLK